MNTQITPLVEQAVLEKLRTGASFTALDISNGLKTDRYPVHHRQVAEIVRDIHQSGAMDHYRYVRDLIPVVTEGGAKPARAFLYRPDSVPACGYTARAQDAVPPVPAADARDLTGSVAAGPLPVLPRPARPRSRAPRQDAGRRTRRDGALGVPRAVIAALGWAAGAVLSLRAEPGRLSLALAAGAGTGNATVRVWDGQRVRVARRKLRLGEVSADRVRVEVGSDSISLIAVASSAAGAARR